MLEDLGFCYNSEGEKKTLYISEILRRVFYLVNVYDNFDEISISLKRS